MLARSVAAVHVSSHVVFAAVRRRLAVAVVVLMVAPLAAFAAPAAAVTAGSFAGKVRGDLVLVGAHLDPPADDGSQTIRLYVCNSVPYAEWFVGTLSGGRAQLTSKSGRASADLTSTETAITGTVRLGGGVTRSFSIRRARAGAGIYRIAVRRDNVITGRSFADDVFVAQRRKARVRGWVVDATDRAHRYDHADLTRLTPGQLRSAGYPTRFSRYRNRSLRPGNYVAVAAYVVLKGRRELTFLGRDAGVLTGRAGSSIIGMESDPP